MVRVTPLLISGADCFGEAPHFHVIMATPMEQVNEIGILTREPENVTVESCSFEGIQDGAIVPMGSFNPDQEIDLRVVDCEFTSCSTGIWDFS